MEKPLENVKIAIALRAARTALGWSQQEFADKMGVAKSTIARIETVEMVAKADFLTRALRLYREMGVIVDLMQEDKVAFTVEIQGLMEAQNRLQNEAMRRSDRRVNVVRGPVAAVEVRAKKSK
jgi:transcriptional regulator with XRE-family HTH domain